MKWPTLLVAALLSGCSVLVPVKPRFPEPVPELIEQCKELQQVPIAAGNPVAITDMLKIIVNNYSLYYQCSNKVDGWNQWYEQQRKIYESVK